MKFKKNANIDRTLKLYNQGVDGSGSKVNHKKLEELKKLN